jgi:hypothetical protein
MPSLSIAALAIRARTRAKVRAFQDKPPTTVRAVAGDGARTSTESLGAHAPKARPPRL